MNWLEELKKLVDSIEAAGMFSVGGSTVSVLPGLIVDGLGSIGLPLNERQAKELMQVCEQAPFGRLDKTILDKSIRNTWQLSPSSFQVINPKWNEFLQSLIPLIQQGLGVAAPIELHLYKLLLYETGGFFKPHKDSEKEDKMFATLIIQLPTYHEGGELIIMHKGKVQNTMSLTFLDKVLTFDFGGLSSAFDFFFASFYADCTHEVLPVRAGYRLNLVYNVVNVGNGVVPPALDERQSESLMTLLKAWEQDQSLSKPNKLVHIMEHKYTTAGIDFNTLKGKDRAVLTMLQRYPTLRVYIGEFVVNTTRIESSDTVETKITLSTLKSSKGTTLPNLSVLSTEILDSNFLNQLPKPNKEKSEETGNEGVAINKWYRRMGIMFFHESDFEKVMGLHYIVSKLERLNSSQAIQYATKITRQLRSFVTGNKEDDDIVLSTLYSLNLPYEFAEYMKFTDYLPERLMDMIAEYGWKIFAEGIIRVAHNSDHPFGIVEYISQLHRVLTQTDIEIIKGIIPAVKKTNRDYDVLVCYYLTGQEDECVEYLASIEPSAYLCGVLHHFLKNKMPFRPFLFMLDRAHSLLEVELASLDAITDLWRLFGPPRLFCYNKNCVHCPKLIEFLQSSFKEMEVTDHDEWVHHKERFSYKYDVKVTENRNRRLVLKMQSFFNEQQQTKTKRIAETKSDLETIQDIAKSIFEIYPSAYFTFLNPSYIK